MPASLPLSNLHTLILESFASAVNDRWVARFFLVRHRELIHLQIFENNI